MRHSIYRNKRSLSIGIMKVMVRRGALFLLCFVLMFGLIEPGLYMAAAESSSNKQFDANFKLAPLASSKSATNTILTQQAGEALESPLPSDAKDYHHEDIAKRTANSTVYVNNDGTKTLEYSSLQKNYYRDGQWKKIDNKLSSNSTKVEPTWWQTVTNTLPEATTPTEYKGKAGNIENISLMSSKQGVSFVAKGKVVTMAPTNSRDVLPIQINDTTVLYESVWDGVDLQYELRGEAIKESIIIRKAIQNTDFTFNVSGGKVTAHPTKPERLAIEGIDANEYSFSELSTDVFGRGPVSNAPVTQTATNSGIKISIDKAWLAQQSFPVTIDPSFTRDRADATMYKSDGYTCGPNTCYLNTGALYDNGWKNWRTVIYFPYNELAGKKVLNAQVFMPMQQGIGGDEAGRWLNIGHANCWCYSCAGGVANSQFVGTDVNFDITNKLQERVNANDFGAAWAVWGEEGAYKTYKPYYAVNVNVVYDTLTPIATPTLPADKQVLVDTQPSLRVNAVTDGDGDSVQYYFRVSTSPDAETGAIINSGWTSSTQWTVPEGVLQDGNTYYWHTYTKGATTTNPNWVRSFRVDLRTGKDSTQSYDTVGPVGVDLATGNASLTAATHDIKALGGNIGLSLTYNTPNRAKRGLAGEYWNVASGYNFTNGTPSSAPTLTRRDQAVDFTWGTSTPTSPITVDNFYVRWTGQFVAPSTGNYQFGGSNDDNMRVWVNNQEVYNNAISGATPMFGSSISLQAGDVVPLRVDYLEVGGSALAKLYVKGAVPQQVVPSEWLRTNVTQSPQGYGLMGRYYTDTARAHDIDVAATDPSRLLMARQDTNMNLNFGTSGAAPGMPADQFMARWTGYITVPSTGDYTLGASSDDGVRIKTQTGTLGTWQTSVDKWQELAGTYWGTSTVHLEANKPTPLTVDWMEYTGGASMSLRIKSTGLGIADQPIPTTWLTPDANPLPSQWQLGLDTNGDLAYERLRATTSSAILEDSTRSTHEYIYSNGAYRPPVNESGVLVRNNDKTYTLTDSDGRVYLFNADGTLRSVSTPTSSTQPVALKYIYGGSPSRLLKIEDATTNERFGTLYYKNINDTNNICDKNGTNNPSGLLGLSPSFADAPNGMLCAFTTTDGKTTNIYYDSNGYLARIVEPGGQVTDYSYDAFGRIVGTRDSLAADSIAAGLRAGDDTVISQLTYDTLGRISAIKAPAATTNAQRLEHTFSYIPNTTTMHITGASEPNGYSKRTSYDQLLRTTTETDLTGKTITTEWDAVKDLQLSKTDATGLKSTTIYDTNDRPIDSYGPAPSDWFGVDRKPTSTYTNQVPKTSTGYDEGINGPAVAWFDYKLAANGTFVGAPRLYTTGFPNGYSSDVFWMNTAASSAPITKSIDADGIGFSATGTISFPTSATRKLTLIHDDAARLYINDVIVIDKWTNRGDNVIFTDINYTFTAGQVYRFRVDYANTNNANMAFKFLYDSSTSTPAQDKPWGAIMKPAYNLVTSSTAYDSTLGNVTSTTQYSNPAYGQIGSTTLDPSGLNYQAQATYEAPGTGFLRQTSKTLPGGAKTTYQHYSGTETRDNPCTEATEAYHQAGFPKGKVEPDPDGAGPLTGRTSEAIYNESGDVVATRYNTDPWTCTEYDTRGRVLKTVVPSFDGKPGRTIENDYAVSGNPLVTETRDSSGTIRVESDLLGRTVRYVDARGNETTNTYDTYGKLSSRTSPIGTEAYEYDQYDRLTTQKLDGVTMATVTYDEFSRIQSVQYPAAINLQPATRDALGRVTKVTYSVGEQSMADEVTRSTTGLITSGIENGVIKNYTYDKADRLLGATIGGDSFAYGYSNPDPVCSSVAGNNPSAAKDSNRTSTTINGQTTTYCYNMADQLITSSDPWLSNPTYDDHGNTTVLGDATHRTEFSYDTSDRNTAVSQSIHNNVQQTTYLRDTTDRIMRRTTTVNGATSNDSFYGFTGSGDSPDLVTDANGAVVQKYVTLPGGVTVTIKPQSTSAGAATYSLSNLHGDTMATVNADGTPTIIAPTGPFGEKRPTTSNAINTVQGTTYSYLGTHQKMMEEEYAIQPIQMGARVYIPMLGRFLQVDPVEGGTSNNYLYVADPVNQRDLNGRFAFALALVPVISSLGGWGSAIATGLAGGVVAGVTVGAFIRSTSQSKSVAKSKSVAIPKQQSRCASYKPALFLPTIERKTLAATYTNPQVFSGTLQITTNLAIGNKLGKPIGVSLSDSRYQGWVKYAYSPGSINGQSRMYDFHYNIYEPDCLYAGVKEKITEGK